MCEENKVSTKICSCCGKEIPTTNFKHHPRSKDGYAKVCNSCKSKLKGGNPKLSEFHPRELIEELKIRGYTGKLVYVQKHEIIL